MLISVTEGHMKKGIFDGFARVVEASGSVKVGYWKTLNIDSSN